MKINREYIGWLIFSLILIIANIVTTVMPDLIYKDSYSSCYIMLFLASIIYRSTLSIGLECINRNFRRIKNIRKNILLTRYHDYESNKLNTHHEHKWLRFYIVTLILVNIAHAVATYVLYRSYHPVSLIVLIVILIMNAFIITIEFLELAYVCSEWQTCQNLDKIYGLIISGRLTETEDIRKAIEDVTN